MHDNVGTEEEERGETCSIRRAARDQLVMNNLLVLLDGDNMNEGRKHMYSFVVWIVIGLLLLLLYR